MLNLPFERLEQAALEDARKRTPSERIRDAVELSGVSARLAAGSPQSDQILRMMEQEEEEERRFILNLIETARG